MKENLILIGFMGSGKSLTSQWLAKKMGKTCLSSDILIEKREGKTIADIFKECGEEYFRKVEHEVISGISQKNDIILDCGGGVVLNPQNMVLLKNSGIVIYLYASPEMIHERTKHKNHRPLLNVKDPLVQIKRLLEQRKPFYAPADYEINTDHKTIETVGKEIMELLDL